MDKRQKILAAAVLLLLGGYLLIQFVFDPWSEAMADAASERRKLQSERTSAEEKARKEPEVAKEWKALKERLSAVKSEEASNRLAGFADQIIRKYDLKKSALSPESPVAVPGNAGFREHPLAFSFQCTWDGFVKLLLDFYSAEEFVRVQRITVQSHYLVEKENYLDVTLRLTTVSTAAAGGSK